LDGLVDTLEHSDKIPVSPHLQFHLDSPGCPQRIAWHSIELPRRATNIQRRDGAECWLELNADDQKITLVMEDD
jgi:hypothetical protein